VENDKIGSVIRKLRLEKEMTQKQLADRMNISDKTVSKWERGVGLPDISFISQLSELLEVDLQNLLLGELTPNPFVGGNMKNAKYYVCPTCSNITVCTGNAEVVCCSKKLSVEKLKKAENDESLTIEKKEDHLFISSEHPMTKEHYISFVAFAKGDRIQIVKQYPEWNLMVHLSDTMHGMLIWYCTKHGLYYQLI